MASASVNIALPVDYDSNYYSEAKDVIFLCARVIDINGMVVTNDSYQVTFQLHSAGELISTNPVKAEAGIATILFKGDLEKLKAEAKSRALIKSINDEVALGSLRR